MQRITHVAAPRTADLLLAYVLPYAVYVVLSAVPESLLAREANFALRIVGCGAALLWGWRRFTRLGGPLDPRTSVTVGALVGLLGTALWIALVTPFAPAAGDPWPVGAFLLRVAAVGLLVPLFEELLLRGLVFRLLFQWQEARRARIGHPLDHALQHRSVNEFTPGAWTAFAVIGSTLLFAIGHAPYEYVACMGYGVLLCALWIWRGDLLACVVAHAVTNVTLAVVVWHQELWQLW